MKRTTRAKREIQSDGQPVGPAFAGLRQGRQSDSASAPARPLRCQPQFFRVGRAPRLTKAQQRAFAALAQSRKPKAGSPPRLKGHKGRTP